MPKSFLYCSHLYLLFDKEWFKQMFWRKIYIYISVRLTQHMSFSVATTGYFSLSPFATFISFLKGWNSYKDQHRIFAKVIENMLTWLLRTYLFFKSWLKFVIKVLWAKPKVVIRVAFKNSLSVLKRSEFICSLIFEVFTFSFWFIFILSILYYDILLPRSNQHCLHWSCFLQKGLWNSNSSFFLKVYCLLIGCFVHFKTHLSEELYLNWVLFFQRTVISAPLSEDILVILKTIRVFREWNMSIDTLLILQTNIILVFVPPEILKNFFGCSVPYNRVIPGPTETGSYKSLS